MVDETECLLTYVVIFALLFEMACRNVGQIKKGIEKMRKKIKNIFSCTPSIFRGITYNKRVGKRKETIRAFSSVG